MELILTFWKKSYRTSVNFVAEQGQSPLYKPQVEVVSWLYRIFFMNTIKVVRHLTYAERRGERKQFLNSSYDWPKKNFGMAHKVGWRCRVKNKAMQWWHRKSGKRTKIGWKESSVTRNLTKLQKLGIDMYYGSFIETLTFLNIFRHLKCFKIWLSRHFQCSGLYLYRTFLHAWFKICKIPFFRGFEGVQISFIKFVPQFFALGHFFARIIGIVFRYTCSTKLIINERLKFCYHSNKFQFTQGVCCVLSCFSHGNDSTA